VSIRILHVEIGRPPRENQSVERAVAQSILENLVLTSIQSRLKLMKALVCRLAYNGYVVAFKMGRRQGARRAHI
jgi:hypothetical protein